MQTPNLSTISDIVGALQNILAHSQVIMPDLETPYSRPSFATTTNHFAIKLKDHNISDIINERQQQLEALDEISDLQTVIDSIGTIRQKLVQQTDKITQSINLHKRLVSTLWHMPTEILSQIFIHCLPDASCQPHTPMQAPMLLIRVCRRWREVAVGTPGLWCRVSMGKNWQRVASSYDSWLKRSRGHRLLLALRCRENQWSELRSFLQPHINQVSSLCLDFSSLARRPKDMIADFQTLEELSISVKHVVPKPAVARYISQPPFTLRSLKLARMSFGLQDFSAFNSAWVHLTNVEIDIHEPKVFPRLLHLCPDLSSLTIATRFIETEVIEHFEPFMHTKLQSLHIFCSHFYPFSFKSYGLFNALSLPNLRVFEGRHVEPWYHDQFMVFLIRSNCPLERLIFGVGTTTTDEQRAEYIALIPSLEVVVDPVHIG